MTVITGGASTMSRQCGNGHRPTIDGTQLHSASGHGCHEKLSNGQEVISWSLGQHGPIFGYGPAWLRDELIHSLATFRSECLSYAPMVEDEVAALIGKIFPDVEQVRFGKTGSDVCAAAVKLARAVTGRETIAVFGYHGNDAEFAHSPQNRGVPQAMQDAVRWFEWGKFPQYGDYSYGVVLHPDLACIMVEVPPVNDRERVAEYLTRLGDRAHEIGALFILDEVVTGFRLSLRGASGCYGIQPDLYCWGKALSNGYAVSALGGRAELMEEFQRGVFFSGTFFDSPFGLTAAKATLQQLITRENEVYPHLWEIGQQFKDGFNQLAQAHNIDAKCVGQAPRTVLQFADEDIRQWFNVECLKRGVLFDRPQFSSMAHTCKIVERSLNTVEQVFKEVERCFGN